MLSIPHCPAPGLCPVNGIRDLVQWCSGRDWSNEFVFGLGLGGGFAYLRFNSADPPRQVFWGNAGARQHKDLAELLGAGYREIENRTFRFSWEKVKEAVDKGTPPLLGPLDMFYLHFYPDIYHKRHIPIHYELLVGYENDVAYVLDTGITEVQGIPLDDLRLAWDVNVPGLGKRNRSVIFDIPRSLPPTNVLVRKSIADQCQRMLLPPASMLGVPAMKKLAREISRWPQELGEDIAAKCLLQVREYLNSPPDLEGDHLTAGRDLYIAFLQEAEEVTGLDFSKPIRRLGESLGTISKIAEAIRENQLEGAAACIQHVADVEADAFTVLRNIIGVMNHPLAS